jgi:hypothetical protein
MLEAGGWRREVEGEIEEAGNQWMRASTVTNGMAGRVATVLMMASVRTGNALIVIGVSGLAWFLCLRPSVSM